MEALARFVEDYNHERLHEAIPQMGARTLSKKIGPTVPEDLTTYTRQKSLFDDEEEPEPSLQIGPKPKNAHPFGREGTTPHHYM